MEARVYVDSLRGLSEAVWCEHAFLKEPLRNKLTQEQRQAFYARAAACGRETAQELKRRCPGRSPQEIAGEFGITVRFEPTQEGGGYTMFASFREPDLITVYEENADKTDALLREAGVWEALGSVPCAQLLLCHELYHVLEQRLPNLFTAQKHLTVMKLGPFTRRCRLCCLEEVGAMAFAREFTGLSCNPALYTVLMLLPCAPQEAARQHEALMKLAQTDENPNTEGGQ